MWRALARHEAALLAAVAAPFWARLSSEKSHAIGVSDSFWGSVYEACEGGLVLRMDEVRFLRQVGSPVKT
jgi:hypothetical protein